MKKLLLTAFGVLAMAGTASAADMAVKALPPAPPSCTWCGFYVGVNGGYGWGERTGDLIAFSNGLAIPLAVTGGTIPGTFGVRPEGWLAGGQAGYNWQTGSVVFGVEADIQASGIRQSVVIFNPGVPALGLVPTLHTTKSELDWFGTARGRLGFAWNSVLLYGTGGLAYGGIGESVTSLPSPAPPFTPLGHGISSDTRVGWTAGAGFEWAFAPSWSVKGEYLRIDLGSTNTIAGFAPTSPTDFLTYRFKHQYDIARVGINYRFGATPVVAKY
jgi:outer membrane immunogenic protein